MPWPDRAHGQLGELFAHIDLKVLDQGPAQRLPHLKVFPGGAAINGALDLEQRIDPPHDLDCDGGQWDLLFTAALRRAFSSMSAMATNGRRAWTQHAASRIGPGCRPAR